MAQLAQNISMPDNPAALLLIFGLLMVTGGVLNSGPLAVIKARDRRLFEL
jgi:hypothetical protein